MNFSEKSIFIWDVTAIDNGDPSKIVERLEGAGFEGVYLHWQNLEDWRKHFSPDLITALKAAGITVYGSAAIYGSNPPWDGHRAGAIVNEFNLAGFVFDAEGVFDSKPSAYSNAAVTLRAYKQLTARPSAWCWWPLYQNSTGKVIYQPKGVLQEAMKEADFGMPMAYWNWGDSPQKAVEYLNESWKQWRAITNKPLVVAGRAFVGDGGTAKPDAIQAYEARCRELGAHAVGWWSMQHAIRLPDCWEALTKLEGFIRRPVMGNALGLYTENADWTNPNFDFVCGFAGKSWLDTPTNLKAIDEKAASQKIPFFLWYKFSTDFYSRYQIRPVDSLWPPVEKDEPLQKLILAMKNRNVSAVVIEVMDNKNHDGVDELDSYISYAAQKFVGRVFDWLKVNKPNVKLIVASSNQFISTQAANMNNWVGQYNSCAVQASKLPLVESFPDANDKPAYLDNRPTCEFWRYYEMKSGALVLYRMGDRKSLFDWLGFKMGSDTNPPPPPPVVTPTVDARLKVLEDHMAKMRVFIAAMEVALEDLR